MGPPFICTRGYPQVATQAGVKLENAVLGTTICTVLSYLTLTAGDKGIKCPSRSPKQCREGTVRGATVCHDDYPVSVASPPHAPGCAAFRHVRSEWPQSDTLVDELERRRRVVTCRGKRLAAVDALSRPGACCSPVLAGTRGASQQVSCRALVGLPSKLLLPGPCASSGRPGKLRLPGPCSLWVAFPASSSCRGLGSNTLFLDGPERDHGEFWRSPGKPCRGVLRLPVHKFGGLRYPYFSTPTGAPGPGPYTMPSAVWAGPKQCTGTRGLGHTASASASTTPSPNGTRRMRHRGERRARHDARPRGCSPQRKHMACFLPLGAPGYPSFFLT